MDRVNTFVAVALGSNLGDRRGHLQWAVEQLADFIDNLIVSSVIETEAVGVDDVQPPYLNAVAVGETRVAPHELLSRLHALEERQGRQRPHRWAPRTLDLDLLLYGGRTIHDAVLTVPHPRFRERGFVLEPLAEVAPDAQDPVTGKTVRELFASFLVKGY